ncbi:hypothetical protein C8Q79DRAFT_1107076 [Trametes meyenii]|nr:hypothetical protein C8Q79DRAFT_1107076 [Trametes meyenii]
MATTTIEGFSINLPYNFPFFENQSDYVHFQHSALYDYRKNADSCQMLIQCSYHLMKNPFADIVRNINDGDPEIVLDVAIRYFTGCTVKPANIDRALYLFEMITHADHDWALDSNKVAPDLLARAYSCLANAYFELHGSACRGVRIERDLTLNPRSRRMIQLPLPSGRPDFGLANDYLYVSAMYADAAAALGLVTPAVLGMGEYLTRIGGRDGMDLRKSGRYARLGNMWRVFEVRVCKWKEEQHKRAVKIAKAPNAYTCAAPGCGICAKQKKGLMRCAGRCPVARKPHYCSKECQKKDWMAHKSFCKPDEELGGASPGRAVGDAPVLNVDEIEAIDWDPNVTKVEILKGENHRGGSIDINIPGGETVKMVTGDAMPDLLRWLKKRAEERE